jgi:peptidoglycan-associated lipoprotein
MNTAAKLIFGMAFTAMTACTNPLHLGGGDDSAQNSGGQITGLTPGGLSDPTSIVHFQQAIGDRVLFEVDQSTLTPVAQNLLTSQAHWLTGNMGYTAIIEGHADEQGTREYNLALGARRADAVRNYLVSQGVAATRLQVLSYGKERPLQICSDESCYQQNRRAVTVLKAGISG